VIAAAAAQLVNALLVVVARKLGAPDNLLIVPVHMARCGRELEARSRAPEALDAVCQRRRCSACRTPQSDDDHDIIGVDKVQVVMRGAQQIPAEPRNVSLGYVYADAGLRGKQGERVRELLQEQI
jgi:hypothetical protein